MTGPGKAPRDRALANLFAADPDAGVLRVLQDAGGKTLVKAEVVKVLHAAGVTKMAADKAWTSIQKRLLKSHDHVIVEPGNRYRWSAKPRTPEEVSPQEAVELLAKGGLAKSRRKVLADTVHEALSSRSNELEWTARVRQAEIDGVRLLAELAGEVEELIDNGTEPAAMIRMIRVWVNRSGLDPVGRAGEQTRFDRKKHRSIGSPIRDGAIVIVVRPGYYWKAPDRDLLISKAVVEE